MKKFVSLLLAMVLMAALAVGAYAVPDRNTDYMLERIRLSGAADYQLDIGADANLADLFRQNLYEAMEANALDKTVDWWANDAEQFADLSDKLGNKLGAMTVTDVMPVAVTGYKKVEGDTAEQPVVLSFANKYRVDFAYAAMLGVEKDSHPAATKENATELFDWQMLRAEVVSPTSKNGASYGDLCVYFTPEALEKANGKNAVLAMMSNGGLAGNLRTSLGLGDLVLNQMSVASGSAFSEGDDEGAGTNEGDATTGTPSMTLENLVTAEAISVDTTGRTATVTKYTDGQATQATQATERFLTNNELSAALAAAGAPTNLASTLHIVPMQNQSRGLYQKIFDFVNKDGKPVIDYFGADVRNEVAKMLPGADLNKLELYEAVDAYSVGYRYVHGDKVVDLTMPERFVAGQPMVTVAGTFLSNGDVVFTPLKTEAVGGNARVTFTQNILTRISDGSNNVFFVLYQPLSGK